MKPRLNSLPVVATFTMSLAFAVTAGAQSTWNGTGTSWSAAASWTPNAVPAADAAIIIADTTTNGITMDGTTSRSISTLTMGTNGTRVSGFTVNTQLANTLTINGGVIANGNFLTTSGALTLRGNFVLPADQAWSIAGSGAHSTDQGVFFRDVTTAPAGRSKLTLNGNLTKTGTGQLILGALDLLGPGNLIVEAGSLKFNAGSSLPLVATGTASTIMNGSSVLSVYRNTGTMNITRPIVLNDLATLATRAGNVDVGSTIAFNGAHTLDVANNTGSVTNLSGAWTGTGTVNRTGSTQLNVTGTTTGYTGTLTLSGGTTSITNAFGGSLAVATGGTISSETVVAGSLSLNSGSISANPTTPGSLGTLGSLDLSGLTTVSLASAPTSTAPFTVLTYGTLAAGSAANLTLLGGSGNYRTPVFSSATPGVITLALGSEARTWNGGVAWDINSSLNWLQGDKKYYQLDAVTFGNTGAGTVVLSGVLTPASTTVNSTSDYVFTATAGNLIGGTGTLTKSGTGTFTIGGENTFSGNITINGGILKPTGNKALGANGKTITIASGAVLDTNGVMNTNNDYAAVISGSGVDTFGAIVNNSATDNQSGFGSLTLAADAAIGGYMRWDLRPITAGTGVLNLAGFTLTKLGPNVIGIVDSVAASNGSINVQEGTLNLTRSTISGTGTVSVFNGAVLNFENNTTGSFSKNIVLEDGWLRCAGNAFTLNSQVTLTNFPSIQADVNLTITGPVGGTGVLNKTGAGALILTGAVTNEGEVMVGTGTLQFGAGGTTGSVDKDITNSGTVAFDRSDAITYGKVISGYGAFTKQGAGVLTLTAEQAYSGNTNVNGGTLLLSGGSNRLPIGSLVNFANTAGAKLDLNSLNQEVRGIGGGGVTGGVVGSGGGSPVLTVRPAGNDSPTFVGQVQDNLRLEVMGSKTVPSFTAPRQRFNGVANTYTGGTLIDGATLMARLDGSLGAVPTSFDADNITLQNSGTLFNESEGNLLVLDANRGITLGTGGGGISGGFFNAVTVQGVISGAPGNTLTIISNNSSVILTADNTYAGDTILTPQSGDLISRLQIGNGGSTGSHGTGNVTNNGRLTFNRSDNPVEAAVISGTGAVIQAGVGNLTLTAINTYTGNTEVSAGTLTLADNAGLKFVVTDTASNKITGAGAAVLGGDFTIDTTAVTVASGTWTLVDVSTLTETFNPSFTVAGWSKSGAVWSTTAGGKTWSFSESTGVLTLSSSGGGFSSWIAGFNFSAFPGADLSATGDADGDGIKNAVEMVLGNAPNQSKIENLPTVELVTNPVGVPAGDYMKFSYCRTTASTSAGLVPEAQYGADLAGSWSPAVDGTAGVRIFETENAMIPGHNVVVYIPRSVVGGSKLFGRLSVVVP